MNNLQFLEVIKGIAQNGIYYSKNEYDLVRYQKLLELVNHQYADILDIDYAKIREIFQKEQGISSPKVGINAAIFKEGKLLITQRVDDQLWELPGGWAELNESPREVIVREIAEETSIDINPLEIIEVLTRKPGDYSLTYTSYHIVIRAEIIKGEFKSSTETKAMRFIDSDEIEDIEWHRDHATMALKAFE